MEGKRSTPDWEVALPLPGVLGDAAAHTLTALTALAGTELLIRRVGVGKALKTLTLSTNTMSRFAPTFAGVCFGRFATLLLSWPLIFDANGRL